MSLFFPQEFTESNYNSAIDWLFAQIPNYQNDGQTAYKPGLENITNLCQHFNNPHQNLQFIHIGGTNGKGSTSNMLASILQEAGYKVGLYNSPHLVHFTERIKVNGIPCSKHFVYDMIRQLEALPKEITPSFFEFTTLMAFEYFKQQKVDIAIIEVGLGGRLDATNIITPLVSAITNVQLDHQSILGNTINEIAVEKAGIIKPKVPIIFGDTNDIAKQIMVATSIENNARFIDATLLSNEYECDLKGSYQTKNSKVTLALIAELKALNFSIPQQAIKDGFLNICANTGFIGRWYEYSQSPLTICDTGHNQAGLELVFSQLDDLPQKKHIILGFVNDKNIDEVTQILPKNAVFYFVKPAIARGRDPKSYQNQLDQAKIIYKIFGSVSEGYHSAKQAATENDVIFIGGSNFVVGEFLEKKFGE